MTDQADTPLNPREVATVEAATRTLAALTAEVWALRAEIDALAAELAAARDQIAALRIDASAISMVGLANGSETSLALTRRLLAALSQSGQPTKGEPA